MSIPFNHVFTFHSNEPPHLFKKKSTPFFKERDWAYSIILIRGLYRYRKKQTFKLVCLYIFSWLLACIHSADMTYILGIVYVISNIIFNIYHVMKNTGRSWSGFDCMKEGKPTCRLAFIYGRMKNAVGYPRLPPLPPRFVSVFRLREDKFSSLLFKKRDILSSKLSFFWKLPFGRKSLERPSSLLWRCGRWE